MIAFAGLAVQCSKARGGCGRPAGIRCRSDQNVELTYLHTPRRSAVGRLGEDDRALLGALAWQLRQVILAKRRGRPVREGLEASLLAGIADVLTRAPAGVLG